MRPLDKRRIQKEYTMHKVRSGWKKAYHRLALKYHPDRSDDPSSHDKFILLTCLKEQDEREDEFAARGY